jgi:polysaccharide chain length determinant protein (PEP-CTERM system associated)
MTPGEGISVPRRSLDVEDYIDIVRRHKGWIFGPFLLVLVATVVGVHLYPDSFESRATIRVVPQQVPENMVQAAVSASAMERMMSMAQSVESRNVLTTVIRNFTLYPREIARMPVEDVIEEMKKNIHIDPIIVAAANGKANIPAFTLRYSYENRLLAQRVVSELTSRLINENTTNRSNATFMTEELLKDGVDKAKKELDDIENKLAEFRMRNNGKLPDQVEANMHQMAAAGASVQYLDSVISRANQDKLQLQGNLNILRDRLTALKKEPIDQIAAAQVAAQQKSDRMYEIEREITRLENQLALDRQRMTEKNPDVQADVTRLAVARQRKEDLIKEEAAAAGKKDAPASAASAAPRLLTLQAQREIRDVEEQIQRGQIQIEALDNNIADYNKQLKRANETLKAYQARVETVPLGEKEYGDLLRERELAKQKYMELDTKLAKAQLSKQMEDRKQGELLEILDPASLPRDPTDPKRPLIIAVGAGVGLILGIVIAGAREMKDSSLKNLKDVRAYTQMAILGSIPLLENDFVVRRRRRIAWLGWTTACLAATVVMAGSVIYYFATRS